MTMIGIGINENVYLKNAELDEKNYLIITFAEKMENRPKNIFEQLNDEKVIETIPDVSIRLFPFNVPTDTKWTQEKKLDIVGADMNKTKAILMHLMKAYMPTEQAKLNLFGGTLVDANNYSTEMLKNEVLKQIHLNMANQFIQLTKPYFNNDTLLFRLILVRQSKEKHFPTFRAKHLEENPMYESMDIPKAASKVAFTKYELDNGLDSTKVFSKDEADKTDGGSSNTSGGSTTSEGLTASAVFGG